MSIVWFVYVVNRTCPHYGGSELVRKDKKASLSCDTLGKVVKVEEVLLGVEGALRYILTSGHALFPPWLW